MGEATRSDAKRPKCQGTRKDGEPCGAFALPGSPWCFAHNPGQDERRAAARQKGGRNSSKLARLQAALPPALRELYGTLVEALGQVHEGALPPGRAQAMAALARTIVSVLQAGDLEARMVEVEQALKDSLHKQRGFVR